MPVKVTSNLEVWVGNLVASVDDIRHRKDAELDHSDPGNTPSRGVQAHILEEASVKASR